MDDPVPEQPELSPLVPAFRAWIERELPAVYIPDDATLDALLSGNGADVWRNVIQRVVSPKHAAQLRAALQLHIDDDDDDNDEADDDELWDQDELLKLEREAIEAEQEIEVLRNRIVEASRKPDIIRLGVNEVELRAALVEAVVETLDVGTETCQKYSYFLKSMKNRDSLSDAPDSADQAVSRLRAIVVDARTAVKHGHQHDPEAEDGVKVDIKNAKAKVAKLNADLEEFCTTYSLDDVANAVHQLAVDATLEEAFDEENLKSAIIANDPVPETTEEFEKRLSNQLQDEYLALFASSERSSTDEASIPEKRRLDFDGAEEEKGEEPTTAVGTVIEGLQDPETSREFKLAASALDSLDRTLSELTTGSRERISRALREAKQIDITLLAPLKPQLETAYKTQIRRLEWDIDALDKAQQVDLLDLSEPRPCARTWTDLKVNEMENALVEKIRQLQNATERNETRNVMTQLAGRAMKEQERKEIIEEKAKKQLVPMLEKAANAARHTHERTVQAAAAEVAVAVKVDAFVAARTPNGTGSSVSGRPNTKSKPALYGRGDVVETKNLAQ